VKIGGAETWRLPRCVGVFEPGWNLELWSLCRQAGVLSGGGYALLLVLGASLCSDFFRSGWRWGKKCGLDVWCGC
jgi:hypothetical protein